MHTATKMTMPAVTIVIVPEGPGVTGDLIPVNVSRALAR
jgi:hypothetical protein